ncbi:MAG: hypothetical protein K1X44_09065 [Alphaproteobacteria bacterium]|nr:hypothetical protein [Alphaproteobacteria bacterium]
MAVKKYSNKEVENILRNVPEFNDYYNRQEKWDKWFNHLIGFTLFVNLGYYVFFLLCRSYFPEIYQAWIDWTQPVTIWVAEHLPVTRGAIESLTFRGAVHRTEIYAHMIAVYLVINIINSIFFFVRWLFIVLFKFDHFFKYVRVDYYSRMIRAYGQNKKWDYRYFQLKTFIIAILALIIFSLSFSTGHFFGPSYSQIHRYDYGMIILGGGYMGVFLILNGLFLFTLNFVVSLFKKVPDHTIDIIVNNKLSNY